MKYNDTKENVHDTRSENLVPKAGNQCSSLFGDKSAVFR